jgi:uncharacterized protein involved in response to NO
MLGAGHLPASPIAAIDAAFLLLVAGVLVRTLWRKGQRQNYAVVALVDVLALANAACSPSPPSRPQAVRPSRTECRATCRRRLR